MLGRFCLAELDLNKIQFTYEFVPCLILDDFLEVCINFGPVLQGGRWVGGREGRVAVGSENGGGKMPQVKTRGHQLPSDGPDRSTRPKGHHFVQG